MRLVVSVVIDQLPSWALDRYWESLPPDGALRGGAARGAYFANGRYDYAATYTAPGHATLYTGALPSRHGVLANEIWDPARKRAVSVVDDARHAVLGSQSAFAAPDVVRSPVVADVLEQATGGRAKTVAISLKDRASVIPAGKHADLALFYDSHRGAFTTSSYYASKLPDWLVRWQAARPISEEPSAWSPLHPEELQALLGPDDAPGEGDWLSLGRAFPHDPRRSTAPLSAFRVTPSSTQYMLDLARECVQRLELGRDEVPDLLMLSISGTDYTGHVFGAQSWEYLDHLRRADAALGRFLAELSLVFPLRVLITSDHGVAPLPEQSRKLGHHAERLFPDEIVTRLNRALTSRFALDEPPIAAFVQPFIYLGEKAEHGPARDALVRAAIEELARMPGIQTAFDLRQLRSTAATDSVTRLVQASVSDDAAGDIFVVVGQYSTLDQDLPRGAGTNHGSPWSYDRLVPVIFWGPGVSHGFERSPVAQTRVAATLSALLGVPAPDDANPDILPGIERSSQGAPL